MTREVSTTQAQAAVMEQTAAKFDQAKQNLEGMLTRLMNELEGLRSGWVGLGGTSFEQVKQAWAADQAKIHNALTETASAIRTSGRVYSATDQEAAGRFRPGGISLPL